MLLQPELQTSIDLGIDIHNLVDLVLKQLWHAVKQITII